MRLVPRDYLTETEAAEALGVSTETLQSWVAAGDFPSQEVAGRVVVPLREFRQWHEELLGRMRVALDQPIPAMVEVLPDGCEVDLVQGNRQETLKAMVSILAEQGGVTDSDRVLAALANHVRRFPAAPGSGIATPHVRHPRVVGVRMAVGHIDSPIEDYLDLEGRPTRVVLLLVASPSERPGYVALLSRLAKALSEADVRGSLLNASSAEEVRGELATYVWGQSER